MNPLTLIRHVMVCAMALSLGAVARCGDLAPRPSASPVATGRGESAIPKEMQLTALPERGLSADQDTMTRERVELGRLLFFDPILSSTRDVACATCHVPEFGWGDGRPSPVGVGGRGMGPMRVWVGMEGGSTVSARALPILTRNVPTLLNVAFNGSLAGIEIEPLRAPMFWDSREHGLEAQALVPLRTLGEMLGPGCDETSAVPRVVERVGAVAEYRSRFQSAFGGRGTAEERTRSEVRGNAGSVSAREPARTAAGEARESGGGESGDCRAPRDGPGYVRAHIGHSRRPSGPLSARGYTGV